jgi:hypothetical protein
MGYQIGCPICPPYVPLCIPSIAHITNCKRAAATQKNGKGETKVFLDEHYFDNVFLSLNDLVIPKGGRIHHEYNLAIVPSLLLRSSNMKKNNHRHFLKCLYTRENRFEDS